MLQLLLALLLVRLKADTTVTSANATGTSVASGFSQTAPSPETVTDIRVQGNVLTPDDEMRRLAGVAIGAPFTADMPAAVAARLTATKKFESVQVLKRFASIADPSQVVLVILVNEGPVKLEIFGGVPDGPPGVSRVVRRRGLGLMWWPLLDSEDGYGFSYGIQLARTKVAGKNSRLSFPLTWGGQKQAGAQLEKTFDSGPLTRVATGAAITQSTNPFYEEDDTRNRVWVRAERAIGSPLHIGATAGWQHVSFINTTGSFTHVGADVIFDTRLDPFLARNAVYGRASIERLEFDQSATPSTGATRTELEGQGYLGLIGQNILVVRAFRQDSDVPLPLYLQPMLGGMANLRGFRAGSAVGDTLVAGSAEIRAPLTSPLNFGKFGVNAFMDIGTIYNKGQQLSSQHFSRGVGGGIWFVAAVFRMNLEVAHGIGAGTRVHFGTSLSF